GSLSRQMERAATETRSLRIPSRVASVFFLRARCPHECTKQTLAGLRSRGTGGPAPGYERRRGARPEYLILCDRELFRGVPALAQGEDYAATGRAGEVSRKALAKREQKPRSRILTVGLGIGDVLREVGHDAEHRTARLNIAAPAEPGRLRTTFADVVSSPLPKRLTALVTDWIRFAPKAQGAQDGAGTTKSSRLD